MKEISRGAKMLFKTADSSLLDRNKRNNRKYLHIYNKGIKI